MEDYNIDNHTELVINMLRAVLQERYTSGERERVIEVESECQSGQLTFRQRIRLEFDVNQSSC